jgi:protein-S-isoprenylcysteine O-methyltransferase Ste14
MLTTILAYILVALFFFIEGRLRKGQQAQTFNAGASDRHSTSRLGMAYGIAIISLLFAPILNYWSPGHISSVIPGWIGLVIAFSGIVLRIWANLSLGRFYTRTLRVLDNQTVIQHGLYRFIRHPGYLGTILMLTGAGLATSNWIIVLLVLVTTSLAYHYRIQTEEAMLLEHLGQQYADYKAHTWKLLPLVY